MRITGGKLRGIKFDFPKNKDTRPTSSLVRLSIFNSIGVNNIEGKLVLDMFAGSGSLGIEALSRNAKHVDFVEISKSNCITLKKICIYWEYKIWLIFIAKRWKNF